MRMAPIVLLVVVVAAIGATLGTTVLWIIAGLSVAALVTLIVYMARADSFVGPRVLVDDLSESIEALGRDDAPADEAEYVLVRKDTK